MIFLSRPNACNRTHAVFNGSAPAEALLVVDIGDSSALSFHAPFVKKHGLPAAGQKVISTFTRGLGGKSPEIICRVDPDSNRTIYSKTPDNRIRSGKQRLNGRCKLRWLVGRRNPPKIPSHFRLSERNALLRAHISFDEPYEADMSGLAIICTGPDLKTIQIDQVRESSPAAEAGLQSGDTITSIDGKPSSDLTIARIREMFKKDEVEYILAIRRGDRESKVRLKVRREV